MTDYAVRAVDVSKRFLIHSEKRTSIKERFVRGRPPKAREFWALKNANFEIPKGQTFGIIGHNGSGKSTALKVLTGVYRPTSGSVEVNGRVSALLELGAGFHPELTGRENIRLNGSILGFSPKQVESMMDDIIDFSGVEEFIDTPVKVYSSGMYVRLGFAIAVKVDPEVLLVDEVIAVGDEQFQRKCFDYLYELRRKGSTIVLVSHGMGQVEELCDQVVWLDHGEVQEIGPSREVVKSYMHRVNEAEGGSRDLQERFGENVSGSGEVVIDTFEMTSPESEIIPGSGLSFLLRYTSSIDVSELSLRVELFTEGGMCVSVCDSSWDGGFRLTEQQAWVEFVVPHLPLAEGIYDLSVVASTRGHVHFRHESIARLRVQPGHMKTGGVADLGGSWRVRQELHPA